MSVLPAAPVPAAPVPAAPPLAGAHPLELNLSVAPGPDGRHWVLLTFASVLISATVRVPADAADQLAEQIHRELTAAAAEARRANSGIVIASQLPPTGAN